MAYEDKEVLGRSLNCSAFIDVSLLANGTGVKKGVVLEELFVLHS